MSNDQKTQDEETINHLREKLIEMQGELDKMRMERNHLLEMLSVNGVRVMPEGLVFDNERNT